MKFVKKQNVFGWILCVAAVLSLVSMILYIVNSTSGYMKGIDVNATPIVLPILAILGSAALWLFSDKLDDRLTGLATFALAILLAVSAVIFAIERVDVIGDMLNPVNHPVAQEKAVSGAIVGIVFYIVTFLIYTVTTFAGRLTKKEI